MELLSGALEFIKGIPGGVLGAGAAALGTVLLPVIYKFGEKQAVKLISGAVRDLIKKAMDPKAKDKKLRELVKAFTISGIALAEYAVPDRGKGKDGFKKLEKRLTEKIGKHGKYLAKILQEVVYAADDEMDKALKK